VRLYSEAIELDARNHILYSNRSAAFVKMGQFGPALRDAVKAKDLNRSWPKVGNGDTAGATPKRDQNELEFW
jgi:stress-induced-phosphoprotein 1